MKIAAVVAEFNPLHKGHVLPLQKAREVVGEDGAVVCIMSGNVVQRGDFAIFPKEIRTQAALIKGADLVIELPCVYALSSAEYFAEGALALLHAMGIKDSHLVFGSESGDIASLIQAAGQLDSEDTQGAIRSYLKEGYSYGAACQAALSKVSEVGEVLEHPNNLLGISYLRAIQKLGAKHIRAHAIKRRGVAHDANCPSENFASATYLRTGLLEDSPQWQYMPKEVGDLFKQAMQEGLRPVSLLQIELVVLALLRAQSGQEYVFLDDSEGLGAKIVQSAILAGSLEELVQMVKSKRYHYSRIRRMILGMCLGFTVGDRPKCPPYIRILGAKEKGQEVLAHMKESATLPIVSRPGQIKKLGKKAQRMFALEQKVTDLYHLCARDSAARRGGTEWQGKPIFIKGK